MSKNFFNFKRKILVGIIIKALLLGVSAGLLLASSVALAQKLIVGEINALWCSLAGLVPLIVASGVYLLVCFPTEKRIARQLDNKLALNEKVQTMVAFKEESGAIIEMQRENTDSILGKVNPKSLVRKTVWLNLVVPVLAIVMLVLAIVIPAKVIAPPEPDGPIEPIDPDFDMTKIQIQELEDLIEYVKDSNMETEPRALMVAQLEELLDFLKTTEEIKVSEMKEKVIAVINEARKILDDTNSSDDISYELNGSGNEYLISLAATIQSLNYTAVEVAISGMEGTLPDTITKDELKALSATYSTLVKDALVSSEIEETDILFIALLQLANRLSDIADKIDETTMSEIQLEKELAFENARIDVRTALNIQLNNSEVTETIVDELVEIFDLALGEIPEYEDEDYFEAVNTPGDDTPPNEGNGGGLGNGEMLYGSNDKVYDPISGEFVEYGTLIDAYLAKVTEQVQDGKVPTELEDFINDYFATLYGGSKSE